MLSPSVKASLGTNRTTTTGLVKIRNPQLARPQVSSKLAASQITEDLLIKGAADFASVKLILVLVLKVSIRTNVSRGEVATQSHFADPKMVRREGYTSPHH